MLEEVQKLLEKEDLEEARVKNNQALDLLLDLQEDLSKKDKDSEMKNIEDQILNNGFRMNLLLQEQILREFL